MHKLIAFTSDPIDTTIRALIRVLGTLTVFLHGVLKDPVWRSFDGRVTRVSRMSDDHLVNTVAMLIRQGDQRASYAFEHLFREVTRRDLHGRVRGRVMGETLSRQPALRYAGAISGRWTSNRGPRSL